MIFVWSVSLISRWSDSSSGLADSGPCWPDIRRHPWLRKNDSSREDQIIYFIFHWRWEEGGGAAETRVTRRYKQKLGTLNQRRWLRSAAFRSRGEKPQRCCCCRSSVIFAHEDEDSSAPPLTTGLGSEHNRFSRAHLLLRSLFWLKHTVWSPQNRFVSAGQDGKRPEDKLDLNADEPLKQTDSSVCSWILVSQENSNRRLV